MKDRILCERLGERDELGPIVSFLASGDSSYIDGSLLMIDGSFSTGGEKNIVYLTNR